jgi:hypothetical protein
MDALTIRAHRLRLRLGFLLSWRHIVFITWPPHISLGPCKQASTCRVSSRGLVGEELLRWLLLLLLLLLLLI